MAGKGRKGQKVFEVRWLLNDSTTTIDLLKLAVMQRLRRTHPQGLWPWIRQRIPVRIRICRQKILLGRGWSFPGPVFMWVKV